MFITARTLKGNSNFIQKTSLEIFKKLQARKVSSLEKQKLLWKLQGNFTSTHQSRVRTQSMTPRDAGSEGDRCLINLKKNREMERVSRVSQTSHRPTGPARAGGVFPLCSLNMQTHHHQHLSNTTHRSNTASGRNTSSFVSVTSSHSCLSYTQLMHMSPCCPYVTALGVPLVTFCSF